ncbi:MAG TPA: phosphoglycerate dehydrogenase [Candidatus Binatia bacterium]|jgi:D-3-phosphoglycerate dehydrogenase|nr:phosphoglycerate dehydrogenase [Candidatus Binatia bacterium]
MFRILISDKLGAAGLQCLDQAGDATYDHKPGVSREELLAIIGDYDALIVRSGTRVDAELLAAGKKLRVVGRAGMGVDNIDMRAATMRGIVVMNTPDANSVATAEQAMALMLALCRHLPAAHASLLAGEWRRSDFVGAQLYGKTLGIIGLGRIGRLVAKRAQAFGMNVIAYDPFVSEAVGRELSVLLVDFDDLLAQSDFVTLHTAATPETEKMINADTIAQMKPGVRLVNASRGKIVDEAALAAALKEGKVAGAAVDVYSQEPPQDNPLIGLPNVVHTPHLGASTLEAQRAVATEIVDQVLRALRGEDYPNALNMPIPGGSEYAGARPYVSLAEKIGVLHGALAQESIERVEIEVSGDDVDHLVRPVAAALLKGLLQRTEDESINYINAPLVASERGISVSQTTGVTDIDYPNLISCRVRWQDGQRTLAGVLFGGSEPRIVQVDNYQLDANPKGNVLILQNKDVPGVIGQVGTILAAYEVNIGEWRMGREAPGGEALSFINLDSDPPAPVLRALEKIPAITQVKLVTL